MNLVIFGLGYSADYFARHHGIDRRITATVTTREKAAALSGGNLDVRVFSEDERDPAIADALARADALLLSVPPGADGDPVLAAYESVIEQSKALTRIVYLSTIGVYGDHQGAWIDETAECHPANDRSRWRLDAEDAWRALGDRSGKAVHVLRLAGIYGPGQNALVNLRAGTARRIIKPGQVFNRIHVEDIARSIAACLRADGGGVWNVTDDEPAPAQDVVAYAAALLGVEPPPEIAFDDANLSPMARSFYGESKRVSNRALKQKLGARLAYPTYREALSALLQAGDGRVA